MSRFFKILLVGFIVGIEYLFVLSYDPYPHGEINDVRYRQSEREDAHYNWATHPTPTTEARWFEELRLMHKHEDWKPYAKLGALVVLNVLGIYYFLRNENTTA